MARIDLTEVEDDRLLEALARRAVRVSADLHAVQQRRDAAARDGWDVTTFEDEAARLRDELTELCQILAFA